MCNGTYGMYVLTNISQRAGCNTRSVLKRTLTGLNLEFSFSKILCLMKSKEHVLPEYLPISWGIMIRFIPFSRVLVQCKMQSASSTIWTRVDVSISYDYNYYTTLYVSGHSSKYWSGLSLPDLFLTKLSALSAGTVEIRRLHHCRSVKPHHMMSSLSCSWRSVILLDEILMTDNLWNNSRRSHMTWDNPFWPLLG